MFKPPPQSFVNFQQSTAAQKQPRNPLQQSADATAMAGTGPNLSWGGNMMAPTAQTQPTPQQNSPMGGYSDPGYSNIWNLGGLSEEDQWWNVRAWAPRTQRSLLPLFLKAMGGIEGGMANMDAARAQANEAISTRGRETMVNRDANSTLAAARRMGRMMAAKLRAGGMANADAATDLMAMNSAAQHSSDYRRQINSPEAQAKFGETAMALNNPAMVNPLIPLFANLDASSQGSFQQFLAANAQNDARGFSLGDAMGMLGGMGASWAQGGFKTPK